MKIVRNGELVLSDRIITGDIRIEGERIAAIGPNLEIPKGAEVIDAEGCYVFPGFIDPHTHFQMTNALASTADDFLSGTTAAIAGGTTTIINFASPEEGSLLKGLEEHKRRAKGRCACDYKFHMEITEMNDSVRREISEVVRAGVSSFKLYLAYSFRLGDRDVYDAISAVKPTGALVAAHCENGDLIDAKVGELKAAQHYDISGHCLSRPAVIESEAIGRFVSIGTLAGYPVHIVHVSSKEGLHRVLDERKQGHSVTCETCPQYLVLDRALYELPGFEGGKYVMSPPLRESEDREALQKALADGVFQTVGSDHCSFYFESQKKQGIHDFTKIPGGIPGVEERGLITFEVMVGSEKTSPVEFMKVISENPARLYGMYPRKGTLQVGSDADITILKAGEEQVLSKRNAHTAADYIAYEGFAVHARIKDVLLRGHQVVTDGHVTDTRLGEYIP